MGVLSGTASYHHRLVAFRQYYGIEYKIAQMATLLLRYIPKDGSK